MTFVELHKIDCRKMIHMKRWSLKWKTLSNCYAGLQENRSKNSTESCGRLQHVLSSAGGVLLGAMNNNWKLMEIFQAHRVDFSQKISRSSNLVSVNTTHFMYSPTTQLVESAHMRIACRHKWAKSTERTKAEIRPHCVSVREIESSANERTESSSMSY